MIKKVTRIIVHEGSVEWVDKGLENSLVSTTREFSGRFDGEHSIKEIARFTDVPGKPTEVEGDFKGVISNLFPPRLVIKKLKEEEDLIPKPGDVRVERKP